MHEFARRSPACRETLIQLGALPERIGDLEVGAGGASDGDGGSIKDGQGVVGSVEKTRSAFSSAKEGGGDLRRSGLTLAEKKKKAQVWLLRTDFKAALKKMRLLHSVAHVKACTQKSSNLQGV